MEPATTVRAAGADGVGGLRSSWAARSAPFKALSQPEQLLVVAVALLPFAITGSADTDPVVQRIALATVVGAAGWVWTLRSATSRRDPAAIALFAFIAVAVTSALLSVLPWQSLHGNYSTHLSVCAYAVALGWWGIGRGLSPAATRSIGWALLPGAAFNALIATLQVAFDTSGFDGRGLGLMDNPVYYGSFMMAPLMWSIAVARDRARFGAWLLVVAGLGFGAGVSGSRAAAVALVVVGVVAVAAVRGVRTVLAVAAAVAGMVLSSVYAWVLTSSDTVERLGDTSGGLSQRVDVWVYGLRAFGRRPVLGWGIGHYATGTQRYFTPSFIRSIRYDDISQPFTDPHNLAVFLLTCTGALGVSAFAAFILLAWRGQRSWPLALAAMGVAVTWGLQPTTVHTFPMTALLFGAAVRADRRGAPDDAGAERVHDRAGSAAGRWRALTAAMIVLSASIATYVVIADAQMRITLRGEPAGVERAASWFHRSPGAATWITQYYRNRYLADSADDEARTRMLEWTDRAVAWEAYSAGSWTFKADSQFLIGDYDGVRESLDHAISIQHYNPTAWRLMVQYARLVGDAELERDALAVTCELAIDICEQGPRLALDDPAP